MSHPDFASNQVWIDINGDLQLVDHMIAQMDFPQAVAADLRTVMQHIERRRHDPRLYLAVVGEWSSGKSTLINALLRHELLVSSVLPTTAAATRICYGQQLDLEVMFREHAAPLGYRSDHDQLWDTLHQFVPSGSGEQRTIRRMLALLTAEERVAQHVEQVIIYHPAAFLREGIVILDTPGTNADQQHHTAVTTTVIEQEADVALIIIPAPHPASLTLMDFFASLLQPFLHRCLFLVTQIDKIPPQEQPSLIKVIRQRLADHLDITSPKVYVASPKGVIDICCRDEPAPDYMRVWYERFTRLEQTITARLRRERQINILEHTLRLQNTLFERLTSYLQEQWAFYEQEQREIERHSLQNLTAFTSEQQAACHRLLDRMLPEMQLQVKLAIERYQQEAKEQARSELAHIASGAPLAKWLDRRVPVILKQQTEAMAAALKQVLLPLSDQVRTAQETFAARFAEVYQPLLNLAGQARFSARLPALSTAHLKPAPMAPARQNQSGKAGPSIEQAMRERAGQSVAGAGLGAKLGGMRDKQKLWRALAAHIDDVFTEISAQALSSVDRVIQEHRQALDHFIERYIVYYQATYDHVCAMHQSEQQRLQHLQQTVHASLQEIEQRRTSLQRQQEELASL